MSLAVITCQCGNSESKARSFLKSINYSEWLSIPILKGKERSMAFLNNLPPVPEKEMLRSFLQGASKWVVIVGYDEQNARWSDIAHNAPKSTIEAEFVVDRFS